MAVAPVGDVRPVVFTGNWNKDLAKAICDAAGYSLGRAEVSTFADGEIKVDLQEEMRGKDVVIIQSTSPPVGRNLIELLFMISAANRAGAKTVTAIVPYFGYCRQDRKSSDGSNISASDVATMIEAMGVRRVVAFDLHSAMCEGFFSPRVQVDNILSHHIFLDSLSGLTKVSIVSPDAGAYNRSMQYFNLFCNRYVDCDVNSVIICKQRIAANSVAHAELSGDVKGRDAIIVDDIVDTAGTLCKAAELLLNNGAKSVTAVATHGLLSGPALERIRTSSISRLLITDSIPHSEEVKLEPKIKIISLQKEIAKILANC